MKNNREKNEIIHATLRGKLNEVLQIRGVLLFDFYSIYRGVFVFVIFGLPILLFWMIHLLF